MLCYQTLKRLIKFKMKNFKIDNSSLTLSFRFNKKIQEITKKFLHKKIKIKKNLYRFCLNKSKNDKLHQMIIFQTKNYIGEIKKHPLKDKSYHLISGKQLITIYDAHGKIKKKIIMDKDNFFLWIGKNVYHTNVALNNKSIHMETISGPFDRKKDRKYLR